MMTKFDSTQTHPDNAVLERTGCNAPKITMRISGCTVVLRFADKDNEQALSVVKDILLHSYKDKLFQNKSS